MAESFGNGSGGKLVGFFLIIVSVLFGVFASNNTQIQQLQIKHLQDEVKELRMVSDHGETLAGLAASRVKIKVLNAEVDRMRKLLREHDRLIATLNSSFPRRQ